MNKGDFEHFLSLYGADFDRWPEDVRDAAAAFYARLKENDADDLAALYQDAAFVDDMLALYDVDGAPDADVIARALTQIEQDKIVPFDASKRRHTPVKRAGAVFAGGMRPAVYALAACVILFFAGLSVMTQTVPLSDASRTASTTSYDGGTVVLAMADAAVDHFMDDLMHDYAILADENISDKEMTFLWQLAQAQIVQPVSTVESQDIERFLDDLFDSYQPLPAPGLNLWDLYEQASVVEL